MGGAAGEGYLRTGVVDGMGEGEGGGGAGGVARDLRRGPALDLGTSEAVPRAMVRASRLRLAARRRKISWMATRTASSVLP